MRIEPWVDVLAHALDARFRKLAEHLACAFPDAAPIGVLPAVYFPRLRMGSVVYARWGSGAREVARAFPWHPGYIPPPFTCFVPPVPRRERVFLITDVARIIDEVGRGTNIEDLEGLPIRLGEPRRIARFSSLSAFVGVSSWTKRDGAASIIDAHLLAASRVQATTCIYAFPSLSKVSLYVPLLYVQSSKSYVHETLEKHVMQSLRTPDDEEGAIRDAMRATIDIARLCATNWLNPKSGLLSRAGFDALKDDLTRRMATGEAYAECFFDIDGFKAMNDQLGYDGADRVAAVVADRVLRFVQRDVAEEYAACRKNPRRSPPNGFRALIAHVSGDEYKFFIQTDAVRKTIRPRVATSGRTSRAVRRLVAFTSGLVQVASRRRVAGCGRAGWRQRHAAAFDRVRFGHHLPAARRRVSVSLGIALLDPQRQDLPRSSTIFYPVDDGMLAQYRNGLDDLDTLAERAIDGAKKRGKKRVMFSDGLLFGGGIVLHEISRRRVSISLGYTDGVRVGTTFEVFRRSKRGQVRKDRVAVAGLTVVLVRARMAEARIEWSETKKLKDCWLVVGRAAGLPTRQRTTTGRARALAEIPRGRRKR